MKQERSYLQRYRTAARFTALFGAAIMLAGVLANLFVVVLAGFLVLAYGYGSLQPANQIKAFARQCAADPSHEMAQGLLDSLLRIKKVRLTGPSCLLLENAVEAYAQTPDADPHRVDSLRSALHERVAKKLF